jgi:aminoglycoside phosphotransferase (APT) family kinase protein
VARPPGHGPRASRGHRRTVSIDLDLHPEPLERWLAARRDDQPARIIGVDRPGSGFSAETLIIDLAPPDGPTQAAMPTERLVLRVETPDPAVYPQQAPGLDVEIEIQVRVMRALADTSTVPVAAIVGYEPDRAILGAPFFVMTFVDGQVPIESPIYTQTGFFADATPDERRRLIDDGLAVMAGVHALDWRAAGLDWLVPADATPGVVTQLELWERYARAELGGRDHPLLERAFGWLRDHLPAGGPVGLCWGDPRPGNMIWRDFRCVCATDWEAVSIAPPEVDLGWWLMFDRWSHETAGVEPLPGEPTRDEQRDLYAAHAGRDVGDTFPFEVFAAARYAAIVVRVMNRLVARGDLAADQTIWLENPASACLADLMDERA